MTIEESINILKQYIDYDNPDIPDFYTMEEACKVLIKALEQDQSYNSIKTELEPCEDAISRQAVDDAIYDYSRSCDVNYAQIMEFIDKLPPVTPQPKMGRWIMSDDGLYRPICNNCGAHPWKGYIPTVEEATDVFKYCPNCGAKMSEIPAGAEGSDKK